MIFYLKTTRMICSFKWSVKNQKTLGMKHKVFSIIIWN